MKIIETGKKEAGTKDYQLRVNDRGNLELWLYKKGRIYAKQFFSCGGGQTVPEVVERFYSGKLRFHRMSMRGLGEELK